MNRKYRILIKDGHGYLIQVKFRYFPLWINCDGGRTYPYLEYAKDKVSMKRNRVAWQED